jgi:serine/threonine protein phosphatase PrpC
MITVSWGAVTDAGRVRELNEDSMLAQPPLFVVADGMGGHAAGEVASGLVVREFTQLARSAPVDQEAVLATLARSNQAILDAARDTGDWRGMGTTAIVLANVVDVDGRDAWLAGNIGDSRLYRFFEGELDQVSVDHTEVQELVDAGGITAEAARQHPRRNIILRALGSDPMPATDCWLLPPVPGERFLLFY